MKNVNSLVWGLISLVVLVELLSLTLIF